MPGVVGQWSRWRVRRESVSRFLVLLRTGPDPWVKVRGHAKGSYVSLPNQRRSRTDMLGVDNKNDEKR